MTKSQIQISNQSSKSQSLNYLSFKYSFVIGILSFVILSSFLSFAQSSLDEIPSIPPFTKNDKVLILAPHPDDETIGAGGVIQRALKAGADVYVACMTNGDANQLAFIVYEKRLTFRKGEFIHMGEVRKKETVAALKFLGVDEGKQFFLGYPDFGTMEILLKYWGPTKPYQSMFTRVASVPYAENLSPNALYIGENILNDMKTVLLRVKPTKIFVSHPADTNGDHEATYLFLRIALWDLGNKLKAPQIFPYLVHCVGWPKPRGFHPKLPLLPHEKFICTQIKWMKLDLSDDEVKVKDKATDFYKSQIPYNPWYMHTFSRKNELFGDYPDAILKESANKKIDWQEVCRTPDTESEDSIVFLSYAKKDNKFYIKLALNRKITKGVTSNIYLLPYSKETDFSDMPKLRLVITRTSLLLYNKRSRIFVKQAKMSIADKDSIVIELPMATLNFPNYILSRSKVYTDTAPNDLSAWRALKLE